MLGVGIFSVLSLLLVNFFPIELLISTNGWVLETGRGNSFGFWKFVSEGRGGGQRYHENGGQVKETGLGAVPVSRSMTSEEDGQAVAYCEENSLALLEFSPKGPITICSCALGILNFTSPCPAWSRAPNVFFGSALGFSTSLPAPCCLAGTPPQFQLP